MVQHQSPNLCANVGQFVKGKLGRQLYEFYLSAKTQTRTNEINRHSKSEGEAVAALDR
jgi:hypothetical protein